MKKISMTRWVIIVTIAVLIITGGWSILHRSENGSQISQSEGNGPSSEVRQSLMQPTKGSGVTQQQPTNDKSGLQASSPTASIPPGYSSEIIQIKFKEGTKVDPPEAALPPDLRNSVANITRLSNLSDQDLNKIGAGGFKLWFRITLKPGTDAGAFMESLKRLDNVEIVEPAPLPPPPP